MSDRHARMRGATLRLVAGLVVVNALAITLIELTAIEEGGRRTAVGVAWLALTLMVIVPGLRAVRHARRS